MDQFLPISYSSYQSQSTLPKKKLEQKQEKEVIVPKNYYSIYCAVNAKLKMISKKKHHIDSILNSSRIRLSQSKIIILDTRDIKESFVDSVCALKLKKY